MRHSPAPSGFPAPFVRSRFPWLAVILCAVLALGTGAAALALLFSPRPEGAALFAAFFAVAFGGFLWLAERESLALDAGSGTATLRRRGLLRHRETRVPLAEVNGLGAESKRIRSKRRNADEVLYTTISRPLLFAADGSRHVIFRLHRGGEGAQDLARAGNDWLAAWRAAAHPNE